MAAPAGAVPPPDLEAGLEALAALTPGGEPLVGPQVRARDGYLAGDDALRADSLSGLWRDPEVGLIICARGGFGSSRLLPLLDLGGMAATGKRLMGFSDITCLLLALAAHGLACVHGPVVTQLPRLDQASLADVAALAAGASPWPATLRGQASGRGAARGPLLGGNLTMLCHLLGTPWAPPLAGAVLFLEDTGEVPYRLDRMITQLELAGVLGSVAGVALGALSSSGETPPQRLEAVAGRLEALGLPLVWGLPFGHGAENRAMPVGALAELDARTGTLRVGLDL